MGGLGGGSKVRPPKPVPPAPTPVELDEEVKRRDQDRRRQRINAAGRAGTILTDLSGSKGKATILGRSI